tara:strand:- start:5238 stop:7463 length:2226 start_codon:yes stop_codon:yes gene_type:complete
MEFILYIKLLVFLVFLVFCSITTAGELAKKYIVEHGLESSVGQLFVVGLPTDYKNTVGSSEYKELISELNVSGIIINSYNLPSNSLKKERVKSAVSDVTSLINKIKYESNLIESPLLVFADFESYRYSSIHYPLNPPPNPMVLASTGDTKYSYYSGKLAAAQLKAIGVDVILGPVLDLDKSTQGKVNRMTSMRSFSSSVHVALPHLYAYLDGIRSGGISSFSKHFPSYGGTYEDAHTEPLSYVGSKEQIEEDLKSYNELKNIFDGVMTSHLILQQGADNIPASFSEEFFKKYMSVFSEKIVITDDLSDMESSAHYIKKKYKEFTLEKAALEAFKAGNDFLLFSHINSKNGGKYSKRSNFYVSDVKLAILELTKVIRESPKYREIFEKKLEKILFFKKNKAMKKASGNVSGNVESVLKEFSEGVSVEDFYKEVYSNAIIEISYGKSRSIKNYVAEDKILFLIPEGFDYDEKEFDGYNVDYLIVKRTFNSKQYIEFKRTLLTNLAKYDYVFFSVNSGDHINSIDYVRLEEKELLNKLVVFLHTNPNFIPPALIDEVTIYSNYSLDPISYAIDFDFVKGYFDSKPRKNSSLSIADGSVHNVNNTPAPIKGKYVSKDLDDFKTSYEKILFFENKALKNKIDDLESGSKGYLKINSNVRFLYIFSLFLIFCFYSYTYWKACQINEGWEHYKNNKRIFFIIKSFKIFLLFWILAAFFPNSLIVISIIKILENIGLNWIVMPIFESWS